jgi:hypothetical protein
MGGGGVCRYKHIVLSKHPSSDLVLENRTPYHANQVINSKEGCVKKTIEEMQIEVLEIQRLAASMEVEYWSKKLKAVDTE